MNQRQQKLEALFEAALALESDSEREDYLDRVCPDPELRREVESLLDAHRHPDSLFVEEAPDVEGASRRQPFLESVGTVIGRYKLLEKIGEGGMGVVYMAQQEEPVRRRVALKVIKLGMDTKQVVARFEAERQALALMDHPNIAKVLEAGATDTGRPYFVMELVQGVPITEFCDQNRLWVKDAQFSPDGKRIVTASSNSRAYVWDAQSGQLVTRVRAGNSLGDARFSPDGRRLVTASDDHTAQVWDALTGQPLTRRWEQHGAVYDAEFSPDGKRIVTASWNGTARILDPRTGQALTEPLKHGNRLYSAEFSPDGKRLLTASWDKTARIWDAETGRQVVPALRHDDYLWSAHFSPDGNRAVTASMDHTARIWDAQSGQLLAKPLRHDDRVVCAQFSPDGHRVATASYDGTARVWDATTGQPLTEPLDHGAPVWSAQFSLDGKDLVTAFLTPEIALAEGVQFSPEGKRIVTASSAAQLWDAQTGQALTEPLRYVPAPQFDADGRPVEPVPVDEAARVWDVGFMPSRLPDWLLPLAEAFSGRRLNPKGALEETTLDRAKTIAHLREALQNQPDSGDGVSWGRWLLSNPAERTISPLATMTTPAYLEDRIQQQTKESLAEAATLAFGNPALLQRISEARDRAVQVEFLSSNANLHAGLGQWDAARANLSKLIEAQPDEHWNYLLLAPLLAQSGDLEGYRRLCAGVLARFGRTTDPVVAERMAKACLILPDPAVDLEQVARLADTAITRGRWDIDSAYFALAKGLAEYRRAHFSSAADWVLKALAEPDQSSRDPQAYLVLAMAQFKSGKLAESRAALDVGARIIQTRAPRPASAGPGVDWADWIIARALLKEAKELIGGANEHSP